MRRLVLAVFLTISFWTQTAVPGTITLYVGVDGQRPLVGSVAGAQRQTHGRPLGHRPGRPRQGAAVAIRRGGAGASVTVFVRGGVYHLAEPLVLEPRDSGTAESPVIYAAYGGEHPVLSGGRVIRGCKPGTGGTWTAELPEVAAGRWYFRQIFVNGQRRCRARTPHQGFFTIAGKAPMPTAVSAGKGASRSQTAFLFSPGDVKNWPDRADAEVVVYHSWETSRLRIAEVDEAQRLLTFTGPAAWPFEELGAETAVLRGKSP